MKKLMTIVLMACCSILSTQAQTIKKGDKFWDGRSLYTVQEVRMGTIVYMTTPQDNEMTLEKVGNKPGEYKIIPSRQADECPIRFAEWNWRVQYIRKDGMNFLAVRKPNGDTMWTMVLTPDNEANCEGQQETLEKANWEDVVTNTLLNTPYLMNIPREQLRLMRNEILARHGYTFRSKDLRDYFSKKWWYKPSTNNAAIKLNVIEQTNVELIKSEEAVEPGLHPADVAGDVDQSDFVE
ncbi:MAG: YARHG domain-containing protein [Prevotella sp.]|nr:YARHG domain-containing protein [Prevotella sp.]